MAYLALVRHGLSEWNKIGLWTGLTDVSLAPEGIEEAKEAGRQLKNIHFNHAFTSKLVRAHQTLDEIIKVFGYEIDTDENHALDERDYGIYTGKNKWEIKKKIGDKKYQEIRRGWDPEIPDGENLKQVYDRVVPYYQKEIIPLLKKGKNILISAHGNSLRALVKYLDNISTDNISKLNIATGEIYLYVISADGNVLHKEIRGKNPNKNRV